MTALAAVAGALLILFILVEVFEALVLPRRVTRPYRLSRLYYRAGWRAWRTAARLFRQARTLPAADADRFLAETHQSLEPYNRCGLCDPGRRNMYPYTGSIPVGVCEH